MGDKSPIEWLQGGATWNPIRAELLEAILDKVTGEVLHKAGEIGWFCIKCSPGCAGCYACSMNLWRGNGLEYTIPNRDKVRMFLDEKTLLQPLKWKKPRLIFPCSMTDWMEDSLVPDEWLDKMLAVMALTPQHTYLTLTKRADRQRAYLSTPDLRRRIAREANAMMRGDRIAKNSDALAHVFLWGRLENAEPGEYVNHLVGIADRCWPLPNLWLGVSAENQKYADERIPLLLQTPAAVRWVSAEPLLGPVNIQQIAQEDSDTSCLLFPLAGEFICDGMNEPSRIKGKAKIDWVVTGGESGPKARPMHPQWARSLRDQCVAAGVPFFFKQWGEWQPQYYAQDGTSYLKISVPAWGHPRAEKAREIIMAEGPKETHVNMKRVGKKAAGRLLDGKEWNEYPEVTHG